MGWDSTVSVALDKDWKVRRSNPSGVGFYAFSRPGLGPTQPPTLWVLGLSPGGKVARAWY